MEGIEAPAWFVGDLGDRWVLDIAEALPRNVRWISCPDDFPESWSGSDVAPPRALILHRSNLNATDARRLSSLLARAEKPPRVILCHGVHVRYDDLMRWSRWIDLPIPESVAAETIARHLATTPRETPRRLDSPITVLSTDFEWREMMAEVCRSVGYDAEPHHDLSDPTPDGLIVWDVPVLRDDWSERMRRLSRRAKVLGLFGFADRDVVSRARASGCSACLESPCDVDDVAWVLDRMRAARTLPRVNAAHAVPPAPSFARVADKARSDAEDLRVES